MESTGFLQAPVVATVSSLSMSDDRNEQGKRSSSDKEWSRGFSRSVQVSIIPWHRHLDDENHYT